MSWPSRAAGRVITGNGFPTSKEAPGKVNPVRLANNAAIRMIQVNRFMLKVFLTEGASLQVPGPHIHH
jgi:hypothetical protein